LKKAAQFLKESQLSVTEISFTVGFNDLSRFFRYFKHQFGMSPNAFRKTKEEK
jgi:AraC-like DNA-binding protein